MHTLAVMTHFKVFKIRYRMALPDPDMPSPRYHIIIFVETNANLSGHVHHVVGDIVTGMKYQYAERGRPEADAAIFNKKYIGVVASATYPQAVNAICETLPPPPRQKAFNIQTMKTEPMKPGGTFHQPIETRAPLIKCTEWTEGQAIPALREHGVLRDHVLMALRESQIGHESHD